MTPKEKLRLKELIVRLWYYGEVEKSIGRICSKLGWRTVCNPDLMSDEQHKEIDYFCRVIEKQIAKRRQNGSTRKGGGTHRRRAG